MTEKKRQISSIPRRRRYRPAIQRPADVRMADFLELRAKIGLKNSELAKAIGRSASTMAHYASMGEDGRDVPDDVIDDMREYRRMQALEQLEKIVEELTEYGEDIEIVRKR